MCNFTQVRIGFNAIHIDFHFIFFLNPFSDQIIIAYILQIILNFNIKGFKELRIFFKNHRCKIFKTKYAVSFKIEREMTIEGSRKFPAKDDSRK